MLRPERESVSGTRAGEETNPFFCWSLFVDCTDWRLTGGPGEDGFGGVESGNVAALLGAVWAWALCEEEGGETTADVEGCAEEGVQADAGEPA